MNVTTSQCVGSKRRGCVRVPTYFDHMLEVSDSPIVYTPQGDYLVRDARGRLVLRSETRPLADAVEASRKRTRDLLTYNGVKREPAYLTKLDGTTERIA